ncbi:hypothetical protein HYT23_02775 [Candidatus Pacearchaeota archaeon]|nr:hypothetical protein [Candidatus Pacearchaeota archaeon]
MKNKKAFLLGEETLKIIVALIVIVFLVYFLFALFYSSSTKSKQRQAEAVLEESVSGSIKTAIERARSGQGSVGGNAEEVPVPNPLGWHLFSFTGSEIKPNDCAGENCLCICDKVWAFNAAAPFTDKEERQAGKCDSGGACLAVPDIVDFTDIEIKKSTILLVRNEGGIIITER